MKIKHGFTTINTKHKLYSIWDSMKQRCDNPKHRHYKDYGGRGISYDPKWKNFLNFKNDMIQKWNFYIKIYEEKNLTIERIDNNKNYCKQNCKFTHKYYQNGNTRKTKPFIATNTITGEQIKEKNQRKFAREYNIDHRAIQRLLTGKIKKTKVIWRFKYI